MGNCQIRYELVQRIQPKSKLTDTFRKRVSFMTYFSNLFASIQRRLRLKPHSPQHIFTHIPHKRVVTEKQHSPEVFDLYHLGLFNNAKLVTHHVSDSTIHHHAHQENLELVSLAAKQTYRPHYHRHSQATIYIISGSGSFYLKDEWLEYGSGTRITVAQNIMHGFKTNTQTLFLSIQTPPILDRTTGTVDLHYDEEHKHVA